MTAYLNDEPVEVFVDFGAFCNILKLEILKQLNLNLNQHKTAVKGFEGSVVESLGQAMNVEVKLGSASAFVDFIVVPNHVQKIPAIIGHPFTEQDYIIIYKDADNLYITEKKPDNLPFVIDLPPVKTKFWPCQISIVPPKHAANIKCRAEECGEYYLDSSVRMKENEENCLLRCVVKTNDDGECILPIINCSDRELIVKRKHVFK